MRIGSSARIFGPVVRAPVQDVDRRDDLHRVALGDRLPLLAREQLGDLVELLDQHVGRLAQVAGPVGERQLGPEGLHLGDVVDDRLDLSGLQRLDRADQLAGRGVEGLELPHRPILCARATVEAEPAAPRPTRGTAVFLASGARRGVGSVWLSGWRESSLPRSGPGAECAATRELRRGSPSRSLSRRRISSSRRRSSASNPRSVGS